LKDSPNIDNTYVAFCDILGFSSNVKADFENTIAIYREFKKQVHMKGAIDANISVYSDSIIIEGDSLLKVCHAAQLLLWTTLRHGWIVRGGVAYGKHWKEADESNLFIVSEALVKAVDIEKYVEHPVIALSEEISLGLEYWHLGFQHTVFDLPIIHWDKRNIINPFNNYWFASAVINLRRIKESNPLHKNKYDYLLKLVEAIDSNECFIPQPIIDDLLKQKLIHEAK
jgi:hypothetical protein